VSSKNSGFAPWDRAKQASLEAEVTAKRAASRARIQAKIGRKPDAAVLNLETPSLGLNLAHGGHLPTATP